MDRRHAAVALLTYAVVAGAITFLGLPPTVAIVCVGPLVLFAPGCAVVLALAIPDRAQLPGRRVTLSVALSIATTALGGLLLNAVAPLTRTSWTAWLVGFTCVFSFVAFLRSRRVSSPPAAAMSTPRRLVATHWRGLALGGVAMVLIAGAATLTEISSRNAYEKPVIQMSLLPSRDYSRRVLQLRVANLSTHKERLKLTVTHRRGPKTSSQLVLPPSAVWTREERLGRFGLSAALRRPGEKRPFREVSWTVAPVALARRTTGHPPARLRSAGIRRAARARHATTARSK